MIVRWGLRASDLDGDHHATIVESTTGVVGCGESWCNGRCGLPALTLRVGDKVLRAFGSMVAYGPVFQQFRVPWTGEQVAVDLGETTVNEALQRYWM